MKTTVEQAEVQLSHVRQLMQHPGWAVICERHAKGVRDLTDKILDANTDDEMATRLRHTRATVLELSPEKIATTLESKLSAIVKKAAEEATA